MRTLILLIIFINISAPINKDIKFDQRRVSFKLQDGKRFYPNQSINNLSIIEQISANNFPLFLPPNESTHYDFNKSESIIFYVINGIKQEFLKQQDILYILNMIKNQLYFLYSIAPFSNILVSDNNSKEFLYEKCNKDKLLQKKLKNHFKIVKKRNSTQKLLAKIKNIESQEPFAEDKGHDTKNKVLEEIYSDYLQIRNKLISSKK